MENEGICLECRVVDWERGADQFMMEAGGRGHGRCLRAMRRFEYPVNEEELAKLMIEKNYLAPLAEYIAPDSIQGRVLGSSNNLYLYLAKYGTADQFFAALEISPPKYHGLQDIPYQKVCPIQPTVLTYLLNQVVFHNRGIRDSWLNTFIQAGELECVRRMVEHGYAPFNSDVSISLAAGWGHLETLKYLVNLYGINDAEAVIFSALQGSRWACLEYLHRDLKLDFSSPRILRDVILSDHPEYLIRLWRPEYPTTGLLGIVITHGGIEVLDFLLKQGANLDLVPPPSLRGFRIDHSMLIHLHRLHYPLSADQWREIQPLVLLQNLEVYCRACLLVRRILKRYISHFRDRYYSYPSLGYQRALARFTSH